MKTLFSEKSQSRSNPCPEVIANGLFDNPQPRCPVALLLDVSGSMAGEPMDQLQDGVRRFYQEIASDPFARLSAEVASITYGGQVGASESFVSCADGRIPEVNLPDARGYTPMGEAMLVARKMIQWRRKHYKRAGIASYKPWVVLLTDGFPNDPWKAHAAALREEAEADKIVFFGVAVGPEADLDTLSEILPATNPPLRMKGLRFKPFFRWLSDSLRAVSRDSASTRVILPGVDGWAEPPSSGKRQPFQV